MRAALNGRGDTAAKRSQAKPFCVKRGLFGVLWALMDMAIAGERHLLRTRRQRAGLGQLLSKPALDMKPKIRAAAVDVAETIIARKRRAPEYRTRLGTNFAIRGKRHHCATDIARRFR